MRKHWNWNVAAGALALAHLACAGGAQATPPTRPAEIDNASEANFKELTAQGDFFTVPLRIKVAGGREMADGVVMTTRTFSTDPLKPAEISAVIERAKGTPDGETYIARIPVQKTPGVYKSEIEIGDANGAIYDRAIFFQEVDRNGNSRLYTQKQWRDVRKARRSQNFQTEKSVAELAGDLRIIRDEDLRGLKIAEGNPKSLIVKAEATPGDDAPFVRDGSKDAWRARDPVTFRGRLVFTDFEGTVRPIVNGGVFLYDDDWHGDEFMASTATDFDGRFSFSINNDDGWLQNGRDLFVKLKLRNTRWRVHDGGDYEWSSPQFDDLSEGSVIDIGTMTPDDDMEAVQVFNFMNNAWLHATSVGGSDPGHVEIDYPGGGDFFNGTINLSAATNRAPDIAVHEYGHFLMKAAYPGGDPSPGGGHGFDGDQDARLSWSEGWASGFMLSLCNDGQYNWDEGTNEGFGEWPLCSNQNDTGGRELQRYSGAERLGERQEGRVAAIVLDLLDTSNDANGGDENLGRNGISDDNAANTVSLATIYRDVMVGSGHDNLLEFWTSLSGELSGDVWRGANNAFRYNWASVSAPIDLSCVASKVAAAEIKDYADAIDGLRAFRDTALKPYVDGRELMRLYYRHSPELAEILIKSPGARKNAMAVVAHFSKIGAAANNRAMQEKLLAENPLIVPKEIAAAVDSLFAEVAKSGSPELKRDTLIARKQYERFAPMTFAEIAREAESAPRAADAKGLAPVRHKDLAPRSRKANWALIRKNLPAEAGYSLWPDEAAPQDGTREIQPQKPGDLKLKPTDRQ